MTNERNKSGIAWKIVVVLYMAALFILSTSSKGVIPGEPSLAKEITHNLGHIPAYGLLVMFLHCAFPKMSFKSKVIISIGYGLFNEFAQSMIPERFASWTDALLNTIGSSLAAWLLFLIEKQRRKIKGAATS